jgi:hypothetical protein
MARLPRSKTLTVWLSPEHDELGVDPLALGFEPGDLVVEEVAIGPIERPAQIGRDVDMIRHGWLYMLRLARSCPRSARAPGRFRPTLAWHCLRGV